MRRINSPEKVIPVKVQHHDKEPKRLKNVRDEMLTLTKSEQYKMMKACVDNKGRPKTADSRFR